ncbi:hypothetical protein PPYR_10123 [Photinus pyralis]|uniref:DUF4806 domain-containing protein n=1 Tax=Photinus pyralis TaxID=7054 RepID=A0A5N4AFE8_PHOPY|nr:hypothetical protein PPYR_10123 [Photinus pyralis]
MSIIKNYHVVTFAEDESVEIVPDIWMHPNGQCYWPPKKVKKTQAPDKSSWHLYEIKILGTYSSYEKAREKLILAEVTSDLNTDGERDSKQYRKVSKKKHLSTSNEEGSESDRQSYPSPPKKKLIKEKRLRTQRCSEVTPAKKISQIEAHRSQTESVPVPYEEASGSQIVSPSPHLYREASYSQSVPSLSYEDFQKRIFKEIQSIKVGFTKLVQTVEQNKCRCEKEEEIEPDDVLKYFPLKTTVNVQKMENILDKNEYKNRLITTLSRIGDHKVEEITKLILRKLFVDDLARQYSWMGAKKKLV